MTARQHNPGDIVLLAVPFTDRSAAKVRPAVVVSSTDYNQRERDRILVPVSSRLTRDCPDDVAILDSDPHFPETGLKVSSTVRPGKIFTLEVRVIERMLGHVPGPVLTRIRDRLKSILQT